MNWGLAMYKLTPEIHIPQFTVVSTRDRVPTKTGIYYLYEDGDVELARRYISRELLQDRIRIPLYDLSWARSYSASEFDDLFCKGFNIIRQIPGMGIFMFSRIIHHESGSRHSIGVFFVFRTLVEYFDKIYHDKGYNNNNYWSITEYSTICDVVHETLCQLTHELRSTTRSLSAISANQPEKGYYKITVEHVYGEFEIAFNLTEGSVHMSPIDLEVYQALYPNSTKLKLVERDE